MENYDDIIKDEELRILLNQCLVAEDSGSSVLHDTLTDMEAHILFAGEPLILPSPASEQALMHKLNKKFAYKAGLKWLFTCLSVVAVTAGITLASHKQAVETAALPHMEQHAIQQPEPEIITTTPAVPESKSSNLALPEQVQQLKPLFAEPEPFPVPFLEDRQVQSTKLIYSPFNQAMNSPMPNDSGELYNKSGNVNDVRIDTLFRNVKRLELVSITGSIDVKAIPASDVVKFRSDLNIKKKGLVVHQPDYRVFYKHEGDLLKIWVENRAKHKGSFVAGTLIISGSFHLEVPETIDAVLKNTSGDIVVNGLKGKLCDVTGNYGNIKISGITADVKAKTVSGEMDISSIKGQVDAKSSYGNQVFRNIDGNLHAHCVSGNISLENLNGNLDIQASYGNVSIKHVKGDVSIKNASGSIEGEHIEASQVGIISSYGNIKLNTVKGDLNIESKSGNMTLMAVNGGVTIKSSYGNQQLSGIDGNIRAVSVSGDISVKTCNGDLDIQAGYGNVILKDCKGDVKAVTTSGDITGNNIELLKNMELKANYGSIRMQIHNRMDELNFKLDARSGAMQVNKDGTKQSRDGGSLEVGKGSILIKATTNSGDQSFE